MSTTRESDKGRLGIKEGEVTPSGNDLNGSLGILIRAG